MKTPAIVKKPLRRTGLMQPSKVSLGDRVKCITPIDSARKLEEEQARLAKERFDSQRRLYYQRGAVASAPARSAREKNTRLTKLLRQGFLEERAARKAAQLEAEDRVSDTSSIMESDTSSITECPNSCRRDCADFADDDACSDITITAANLRDEFYSLKSLPSASSICTISSAGTFHTALEPQTEHVVLLWIKQCYMFVWRPRTRD